MKTALAQNLRDWPQRRWLTAAATGVLIFLIVAIVTVLIPNPIFTREVPPTWWSYGALALSSILTGLLVATYVASPIESNGKTNKSGFFGSILTFFAVGCPVCNKLVLLALGTSGAMKFFEPIQPVLALLSIALLGWALLRRITQENSCKLPVPVL